MTTNSTLTAVVHVVVALAGIAAVCVLAARGTISGSDAFTVIVGVLIGTGVLAGANLSSTANPPSPTTTPIAAPPVAPPAQPVPPPPPATA